MCVLNEALIKALGISQPAIDKVLARERQELERRELAYCGNQSLELGDRIVILVDDGLATGASMRAAILAARAQHPARIVAAAPVAARETCRELGLEAEEIVCVHTPEHFEGVGQWYEDFLPTTDEEVRSLLEEGAKIRRAQPGQTLLQEEL